jgi:hypothetical protein
VHNILVAVQAERQPEQGAEHPTQPKARLHSTQEAEGLINVRCAAKYVLALTTPGTQKQLLPQLSPQPALQCIGASTW